MLRSSRRLLTATAYSDRDVARDGVVLAASQHDDMHFGRLAHLYAGGEKRLHPLEKCIACDQRLWILFRENVDFLGFRNIAGNLHWNDGTVFGDLRRLEFDLVRFNESGNLVSSNALAFHCAASALSGSSMDPATAPTMEPINVTNFLRVCSTFMVYALGLLTRCRGSR